MPQIHHLWGRPFEQYIKSFKIEATRKRTGWQDEFEVEKARKKAANVIQKMYRIAAEQEVVKSSNSKGFITLTMLESINNLSYSPLTLADLSHTALISGCTKMMQLASTSLKSSIFSYEYGYLCLRIITIATGMSLLVRSDRVSMALEEMISDTDTDLVAIVSKHVSHMIEDKVVGSAHEREFDWLLGWLTPDDLPPQEPFARRSDMWMLLNMLHANRKQLLIVIGSTYHLGLSGLMFVLWRYHCFDCLMKKLDGHSAEEFIPLFGDILWRYLPIAPTDQFVPLTIIYEQMGKLAELGNPTFIDIEDSRVIIRAYLARLSPIDPRFYSPLPVSAVSVLLLHIVTFLRPGCEDLIPDIFGVTIQRLWKAVVESEVKTPVLVEAMRDELQTLCHYLSWLKIPTINKQIINRVVDEIAENDFVELTLRVLLMLDMGVDETSAEFDLNGQYMAFSGTFFDLLGQVAPEELIQESFSDLTLCLGNFATFLRWRRTLAGATDGERTLIYGAGLAFGKILTGIRQQNSIKEFEHPPGSCSYSRCPCPRGMSGSGLEQQ
ncbi:unnamed protein product [Rhizoctonia solani]|uniref:Uncharacterized protein n=1 Tax=Rhizoctonia solani TaxID=456999 RepID=A0A8H3C5B2_9AGAM|nr:unnamed protein product [Rhizoctonia solani]